MKIILESIRETLSEGRVDDVKKKFPNVNPDLIQYFIDNDPSGNQKYLEWMVKAMDHIPTVRSINGEILGYDGENYGTAFTEPHIETANEILNMVREFHDLQPYLVHTENGKRVGTTDLYQYKFTDSEMIHYLNFDLARAKERKYESEKKKKEKEVRRQADKIYEDKDWLVVRPRTWESSCAYGAGTRWCTTSKESDRHFKRETDKRALVYVLSKSIDSNNPTYKVAWQIPYTRKINKILSIDDVNLNKVKFWDAEDISMGDRYPSLTTEYFSTLPIGLKSAIVDYTQKMMDEYYQGVGFSEDPNMQALVQHLNIPQDNIQDIDKMDFTNFGMSIYVYDDYGYTVASESGVDNARAIWADDFFDNSSFDDAISILGGNYSDYIYITDTHGIATDMADSIISDLSDEDLLDEAKRSRDREVKELLEDYIISSGTESDFDDDEEELEEKFSKEEITPSEYTAELDRIQKERKELSVYLDNKLKTIREILRGLIKREYEDEMSNYPVRWLKDFGWWEDNKPTKKAFELDIVSLDEDAIKSDLENILDLDYFSTTGNYYSTIVDGERYYIFPTDI